MVPWLPAVKEGRPPGEPDLLWFGALDHDRAWVEADGSDLQPLPGRRDLDRDGAHTRGLKPLNAGPELDHGLVDHEAGLVVEDDQLSGEGRRRGVGRRDRGDPGAFNQLRDRRPVLFQGQGSSLDALDGVRNR